MKQIFTLIAFMAFMQTSLNAQECEHLNGSFDTFLDVTELYLGEETELPPNTLVLPENHIPLSRLLTLVFASIFFEEGSDEYNLIWSAGFGMEQTADAYSGNSALRIGGDINVNAADVYAVNACTEIMDSLVLYYKHIGEGADTLTLFYWQDSTISTLPEEIEEFENFSTYVTHEIIVDSTESGFTRLSLPMMKNQNSYAVDTSLFLAFVSGNVEYFDGGGESYFILDDIALKKAAVDNDMDGFAEDVDCDDMNPNVNPGAMEIPYNGIDDDCDPMTLDDDLDMDGFVNAEDCDDTNPDVNPGVMEIPYNGIDDDCDPMTLDDDLDMDGYVNAEDCDDANPDVNPGVMEIPYNGIDDDCDAMTLDDDLDMDGYVNAEDCDDANPDVNPGVMEVPYNGIDDDCDAMTLDDDLDMDGYVNDEDCDDANPNINPGVMEIPYNGIDDDCDAMTLDDDLDMDGYVNDEDCDDTNPDINPGATEIPNNGIDEDCDGSDLMVGVDDLASIDVSVFPNPTNDIINISSPFQMQRIDVHSFSGAVVFSRAIRNQQCNLDIGHLLSGSYILRITGDENQVIQKLIIKL